MMVFSLLFIQINVLSGFGVKAILQIRSWRLRF